MPTMEAMMHTAQLPKTYWDFAAGTTCYLHNKTPHRITKGIPIEKITRTPAKLGHLVTFGSPAYVHIIKPQRRKLDEKAFKGIMVGYSNDSPGYMVCNPTTRRTMVTKHVRSDETFGGRLKPKETPPGDNKNDGAADAPPKMDENTNAKTAPDTITIKTCPEKSPTKVAGIRDKGKEVARTEESSDNDEDKHEGKIRHHNPLRSAASSKSADGAEGPDAAPGKSADGAEGPSAASDKSTAGGSTHDEEPLPENRESSPPPEESNEETAA